MVHVAHFQFRALPAQPAGAQRRQTALMRQFRQRIGLIHELGELRRAEERLDRRGNRLGADHRLRGDAFGVEAGHALANDAFHAQHAQAELVLQQFAHAADALIHQVVDLVHRGHRVLLVQAHQVAQDMDDIFLRQGGDGLGDREAEFFIDHVAPDPRQIIPPRIRKDTREALARQLRRDGIAGTVATVNIDQRLIFIVRRIFLQRRLDQAAHFADDHARQRQCADAASPSRGRCAGHVRPALRPCWDR